MELGDGNSGVDIGTERDSQIEIQITRQGSFFIFNADIKWGRLEKFKWLLLPSLPLSLHPPNRGPQRKRNLWGDQGDVEGKKKSRGKLFTYCKVSLVPFSY